MINFISVKPRDSSPSDWCRGISLFFCRMFVGILLSTTARALSPGVGIGIVLCLDLLEW